MWKQFTPDGFLQYGNFLETVTQLIPMYAMRALGGTLYLVGACIMVYNLMKTAGQGSFEANEAAFRQKMELALKDKTAVVDGALNRREGRSERPPPVPDPHRWWGKPLVLYPMSI